MFDSLYDDVSTPEKLVTYVVNEGCPDRLHGIDINYPARVVAGITLLDAKVPTWWRTDHEHPIDLDILNIASGADCVSAQLSGTHDGSAFIRGRDMLGLTDVSYLLHGFSAENDVAENIPVGRNYDDDEAFDLLTTLWANVIRVRRGLPVDLHI